MVACVRRSDDGSIEFLFSHVYICYIGVYAISITSSRSLKIQRKKPSMRMKRLPKQTMQNLMTSIQCFTAPPSKLPVGGSIIRLSFNRAPAGFRVGDQVSISIRISPRES